MNKKIRIGLTALAVSVTAMTGVTAAADAAPKKKDKITIVAEGGGFHGKVKSKKAFCLNERQVTVYNAATGQAVLNDTTGPDGPVGHRQPRYPHRQLLRQGEGEPGLQGGDVEDGPGPVLGPS